jgi:conjugal transfer pilus assembly protein TraI
MFSLFRRAQRRTPVDTPVARVGPAIDGDAYPSADPGIAARTVDEVLAAHVDLIGRIKLCYGADRPTFDADLLLPIRNYASYVNLLPATSDNFFAEAGGLFRLGLEVSFFALQGTDGHIVSGRSTISVRRHLEPRWRHATFLAGLCAELHRTLSHVIVTDDKGEAWPSYLGPLTPWLIQRRSKRFFVRWLTNAQESRALGLFAVPHVVPLNTMQHLATDNAIAVPHLLASLSGLPLYREQNVLVDLVNRATALVIDRNLIASANRYGRPILGAHLERYLIDAMRRLVASNPTWTPNQERSRVWHGTDGLFVVWPNAANDICKLLEDDELPGIPKSPETILEILVAAGVFEPHRLGHALWTIAPDPSKGTLEAVKLSSPDILLPAHSVHAKPLPRSMLVAVTRAPLSTAPAPPSGESSALALHPPLHAAADSSAQRPLPTSDAATPQAIPSLFVAPVMAAPAVAAPGARDAVEPLPSAVSQALLFFRLAAPMRLNPQVRDVLSLAVDSLNRDPHEALAITVPAGVFIALEHFKRARLDVPVVLRALADANMISLSASASPPYTLQHDMRGQTEIGVVLKPCFVEGLDPANFTLSS